MVVFSTIRLDPARNQIKKTISNIILFENIQEYSKKKNFFSQCFDQFYHMGQVKKKYFYASEFNLYILNQSITIKYRNNTYQQRFDQTA